MNWHSLEDKRILGTVPVEEVGSVAFRVPCDRFVYFQLLDENHRMVQTMRSGTVLQSNETITCIGCHEDRLETNANIRQQVPEALKKPPRDLEKWYGDEMRNFGFMREVQPVFDKYCVECHDYGKPAGEKLNLAHDRDLVFNTAYVSLWNSSYIKCVGAGPAELLKAGNWGANSSPLMKEIEFPQIREHIDADLKGKMSREDIDRIATWLDLNGVYYADYESAYPMSATGRTPFTREELVRFGNLIGENLNPGDFSFDRYKKPVVTFERPELSPGLAQLVERLIVENPNLTQEDAMKHPRYQDALALVHLGLQRLKENPRADMSGFVPCDKDQERLSKAAFRRQEELRFREAIRNGQKAYDSPEKG